MPTREDGGALKRVAMQAGTGRPETIMTTIYGDLFDVREEGVGGCKEESKGQKRGL